MSWGTISTWPGVKAALMKILGADFNLLNANAKQAYDNTIYLKDAVESVSVTVGDVKFNPKYIAPSSAHPWWPLTKADTVLSAANWPPLVEFLRGIKLTYMPGETSEKSAFDVTAWAIATNVATLTFANTTAENKILAALAEDQLIHGSYTNWRTITLAIAIGSITAGTYAITAIDTVNRTVSFSFTASNGSGSVTATAEFYPHRLSTADDSGGTQARHFKIQGRGFMTVNDSDGEFVGSLRRRDKFQGHRMGPYPGTNSIPHRQDPGGPYWVGQQNGWFIGNLHPSTGDPVTDGTNGTPRTGNKTHGPGYGVVAYIYGKTYSA